MMTASPPSDDGPEKKGMKIQSTVISDPEEAEAIRTLEQKTRENARRVAQEREERRQQADIKRQEMLDDLGLEKAAEKADNETLIGLDTELLLSMTSGGPWEKPTAPIRARHRFRTAFRHSAPPGWFRREPKSKGNDLSLFDFGPDRIVTLLLSLVLCVLLFVISAF